jgi:hypothetical protein
MSQSQGAPCTAMRARSTAWAAAVAAATAEPGCCWRRRSAGASSQPMNAAWRLSERSRYAQWAAGSKGGGKEQGGGRELGCPDITPRRPATMQGPPAAGAGKIARPLWTIFDSHCGAWLRCAAALTVCGRDEGDCGVHVDGRETGCSG